MTNPTVAAEELSAPAAAALAEQPTALPDTPSPAAVDKRWIARRWMHEAPDSGTGRRAWPWRWSVNAPRRRAGLVLAGVLAAAATLVVPTAGLAPGMAQATSRMAWAADPLGTAGAEPAVRQLVVPLPAGLQGADSPEARLIDAYQALAEARRRDALQISQALVQSHPGFALGQLLYADLLATRAGTPRFLGAAVADSALQGAVAPAAPAESEADLAALRDESSRRLAALLERPPTDAVPSEFLALPASTRHAVAVDASRSRLYLFVNGAEGLRLERDFYVSLGKLGIDKHANGDLRTPLGVYWITSALTAQQIAPQFGRAAMGINYPNAWDRQQGRSGRGLFVHGVPEALVARQPFATDGCVALANDDMHYLETRLNAVDTPVVISRQLQWVSRDTTTLAAADFRKTYDAWDQVRQHAPAAATQPWHDEGAKLEDDVVRSKAPRSNLSLVAWAGDGQSLMIATSQQAADEAAGLPALTVRQYWVRRQGQWRVLFEGKVPNTEPTSLRTTAVSPKPAS